MSNPASESNILTSMFEALFTESESLSKIRILENQLKTAIEQRNKLQEENDKLKKKMLEAKAILDGLGELKLI